MSKFLLVLAIAEIGIALIGLVLSVRALGGALRRAQHSAAEFGRAPYATSQRHEMAPPVLEEEPIRAPE